MVHDAHILMEFQKYFPRSKLKLTFTTWVVLGTPKIKVSMCCCTEGGALKAGSLKVVHWRWCTEGGALKGVH